MYLTIGMPCYDDYDGVYFSIQALRLYHREALKECELLIVDHNPESPSGIATKKFALSHDITYIPYPESRGPAASKNKVFEKASGPYVLCMDSHVLLERGALQKLIDYYKNNPSTKNLLQGPLVYDCLRKVSTHFRPEWQDNMYGTWATDSKGIDPHAEPFEVPMQGMGLFSCAKDAWLEFNHTFWGFGGEEGYIHEKYRQAGYKTLCLPFLRWIHRFDRPRGITYPLHIEDRIRNYFIGHRELGLYCDEIVEHFTKTQPNIDLKKLIENLDENPSSLALKRAQIPPKEELLEIWEKSFVDFESPTLVKYLKYEISNSIDGHASLLGVLPSTVGKNQWEIGAVSSERKEFPAQNLLNGELGEYWVTNKESRNKFPHFFTLESKSPTALTKLTTFSRGGISEGLPTDLKIYASLNGRRWEEISHLKI